MLGHKSSSSLRTKFHSILFIAFVILIPLYAFADGKESEERRSDGAPKGDPPKPSGVSLADTRCPTCQLKERELKRVTQDLDSKKKEWTESQRDIGNESEYRRELAVKEKGREYLKDDPTIGKEIDELKARLDRLPERKEQLPSLEEKVRELEARKAKLEREIKECRDRCQKEVLKPLTRKGQGAEERVLEVERANPLGPAPRPQSSGCPDDCAAVKEELARLRGELARKSEDVKSLEKLRDARETERKEKEGDLKELESLAEFLPKELTPETREIHRNHADRVAAIQQRLEELAYLIVQGRSALYIVQQEVRNLEGRIKELEECEKKCGEQSKAHLKKVMEPPGSYIIKLAPPACPECERTAKSLQEVQAQLDKNAVLLGRIKESMDLIDRDFSKKENELEDWEAWSKLVSNDAKARAEYDRKTKELNKALDELEDLWYKRQSEMFKILSENERLRPARSRLQGELDRCNKKCPVPGKTSCPAIPFEPLKIGPQLKFGSSASNTAKDVAKNVLGGLLGGFFGGGGSGGSPGSMGEAADKPPLDSNPFKQMGTFTDSGTGTAIRLAGMQTDKGMLLATGIEEGSGKPTIHTITLHRDDDCSIMMPDQYYLYELWLNWHLSVSWTRTTYVDNKVVKRESGGWSKGGSELIGRGIFAADQGGTGSIWERFGFDRATGGPKTVGAEFKDLAKGSTTKFPDKAVVHITRPDQDPVTTVPFVFNLSQRPDGMVDFRHLPAYVTPKLVPTDK